MGGGWVPQLLACSFPLDEIEEIGLILDIGSFISYRGDTVTPDVIRKKLILHGLVKVISQITKYLQMISEAGHYKIHFKPLS